MTKEDSTMGMAVSEVIPVLSPPSTLTFAMSRGEPAAAAEAAASKSSSLAFLFGGIVGGTCWYTSFSCWWFA